MAGKRCQFVSNGEFDQVERVLDDLIRPAIAEFREINELGVERDSEAKSPDRRRQDILDADVVVADITKLLPPNFFNLGIRDQLGRPNIYLVESLSTGYDRVLGFNCITYANNSPSRSLTTLVSAITSALKVEPHENANDGALVTPFSKPSRSQFVTRIREAADSIRLLRLNSAADTVAELEDIATELEELSEKEGARHLHETALKFLRVLSRFADQLSSVRGSRMLISGIIGVVLGEQDFLLSLLTD